MKYFFYLLLLGLLLRALFIGSPGFVADIAFWKSWSLAAIDQDIVTATHSTNTNYPPAFMYVLWYMGSLYRLFGDPHNFAQYWSENNFWFLLSAKSVAIIADIAVAVIIYRFAKHYKKTHAMSSLPLLLSAVFFLNPTVILDSALWGQVESYGMIFTLVAILLVFASRPYLAAAIFITGTQMKLQNIIYIPLFFFYIFLTYDWRTGIKSLASAIGMFFLLNLPFVIAGDMSHVLNLLTVNNDYFPWMSLNAHNLWWIFSSGNGMTMIDKHAVIGIANAKTIGMILFSTSYLLAMILLWYRPTKRNFLFGLTWVIYAFFLLTTQSHERYCYPVLVLLLFFYPLMDTDHVISQTEKKYFWIIYSLLSVSIFFNVYWGLIANYPQYGWDPLTSISTIPATIANAWLMLILFLCFLPYIFKEIGYLLPAATLLLIPLGIFAVQSPYLFSSTMSLTSLKPIRSSQDYGILQINKTVESAQGWKKWNRLSNNYFYYRKGFGTHANSTLSFDIHGLFSTFRTDMGVDTEAGSDASVIFEIVGDGKTLYTSTKQGRFDFPQHAEVSISGVQTLTLLVHDAGDGIGFDHADWLNPILYK